MPQLMPLYWIMSTIMCILFMMLLIKLYANYIDKEDMLYLFKTNNNYKMEKWYW